MLAQCKAICEAIDSGLRGYLLREREKLPQDTLISLGFEREVSSLTREEIEREIFALAAYYKEQYQEIATSNSSDRGIQAQAEELAKFSDGLITVDEAEAVIRSNLAWQRSLDRMPPQVEDYPDRWRS